MSSSKELTNRVRTALAGALPDGLQTVVQPRQLTSATFDVTVRAGHGEHRFIAGWAAKGWPADVTRLVALYPEVEVVLGPALSERAREWLATTNLGWVDELGHARVYLSSGLVISREPTERPTPASVSRAWTKATIAIAEAVLTGTAPTVEAIERATGLSRGATANGLARLERLGLLDRSSARRGPESGRRVVDRGRLLDEYASAADTLRAKQPDVLVHRLWSDPLSALHSEIAPALKEKGIQWALTGPAASVMLAPFLTDVTVLELYVEHALFAKPDIVAELLGGTVVDRGHRIEVREIPTTLTTSGPVVDGVQLALPVRVYADLMAEQGRAVEAAHHLRESLLDGANA